MPITVIKDGKIKLITNSIVRVDSECLSGYPKTIKGNWKRKKDRFKPKKIIIEKENNKVKESYEDKR